MPAARERRNPLIFTITKGQALDVRRPSELMAKGVQESWHLRFDIHDLRGSAVVRLALADTTVPKIATFIGHSLRDVETIRDAHCLGRDTKLAEIAIMKLETRTKL